MKFAKIICALATAWLGLVCLETAQAQATDARQAAIASRLSQVKTMLESLSNAQQQLLSAGAQNLLQLAGAGDQLDTDNQLPANTRSADPVSLSLAHPFEDGQAARRVSDSTADFAHSIMTGFTRSETSTAWCGDHVVVGFNDSGSFVETFPIPTIGLSFSGASISSDRGATFRDIGFINPGPSFFNFLGGDPVVTCVPGSTAVFYYSQIFSTGTPAAPVAAVAISKSTDGGATWGNPLAVAPKSAVTHFLDKPWSAIDPTNPNNMFVTYTDFDISGTVCGLSPAGAPIERIAIELARSTDAGATWTVPQVIVEGCFKAPKFPQVQGSQVVIDHFGNVYVAWENYSSNPPARGLQIVRSADHGLTFGPAVMISPVTRTGVAGAIGRLQGNIRNSEFPLLAIGPKVNNANALYVVWNDGRNFGIPDVIFVRYNYPDILLSQSTDGGVTWSAPIRVNNDPVSHIVAGRALGTDHFQPGIAVDKTGALGVCWYDRSSDPLNFRIGRICAVSSNRGASWDYQSLEENWPPFHAMDIEVNPFYLGDYDTVAADSSGANAGFLGAFGKVTTGPAVLVPNQEVEVFAFRADQ